MILKVRSRLLFPIAERFGSRDISSKLKVLKSDAALDWELRKKRLQSQLYTLLCDAQANVPYYTDLFRSHSFSPEWIKSDIRYIQELPYLTKDILREQGHRLLHSSAHGKKLHVRKTGGSTGPTLPVYYDSESLDWTSAEHLHVLGFTGHRMCSREVHLASQLPEAQSLVTRITDTFKNFALNRVVIKTESLDETTLLSIWKKLRTTRPDLVQGAPSVLYALALYLQKNNYPQEQLFDSFESTGETLDDAKREIIKNQLGCKVYNRYGTAEFGVIAHSRDQHDQLEVVDYLVFPESCSLGNGLNEIVLTGLTNPTMPLIRYKTGDIGEVTFANDKYWISKLQGRVHDLIYIKDKPYLTSYIQDVMDQIGGVDEFQVCICPQGQKTLKVIPSSPTQQAVIQQKLQSLFGNEFRIEFTNFGGLVMQGWRSKFRYVVRQTI